MNNIKDGTTSGAIEKYSAGSVNASASILFIKQ